jgi:hypothetical protein
MFAICVSLNSAPQSETWTAGTSAGHGWLKSNEMRFSGSFFDRSFLRNSGQNRGAGIAGHLPAL